MKGIDIMKKFLVIYYSVSNGNTKKIAKELAEKTGGKFAKIDTVKPYEGSYDEIVEIGKKEVDSHFMPEIKYSGPDIADFDVIAVGTPTWWYTMTPAMLSFLHGTDFSGKTVVPFMTDGGWPGTVIEDMKKEIKGAEIKFPMEVRFDSNRKDNLETPEKDIEKWIDDVKSLLY